MNDTPPAPGAGEPVGASGYDPEAEAAAYPVGADVELQADYNRWLPLVKWLLAIPHYLVLMVLGIGAAFAILFAAFAILFTRRYPRGLFTFVLGVYRWGWRVISYVLLMTDRYPPFTLADDPHYPARLEISYPEEVDRWRPFVQWLLAIPYLVVANVLQNLAYVLVVFAFFVILFAKRFPRGMFDLLLVALRWQVRGNAYAHFMITRYPPFVWA